MLVRSATCTGLIDPALNPPLALPSTSGEGKGGGIDSVDWDLNSFRINSAANGDIDA